MKKRISIIALTTTIIFGIICIVGGAILGGKVYVVQTNSVVSYPKWVNQSEYQELKKRHSKTFNFDKEFAKLEIDLDYANITIKKGEEFEIQSESTKESKLKVEELGDTVKISNHRDRGITIVGLLDDIEKDKIIIVVPDTMSDIDMDVDLSTLTVSDVTLTKLALNADASSTKIINSNIDNLTLDIDAGSVALTTVESKEVEADVSAGRLEANTLTVDTMEIDADATSIELHDFTLSKKLESDLDVSDMDIDFTGIEDDYSFTSKSDVSKVKLNGRSLDNIKSGDAKVEIKASASTVKMTTK